VWLFYSSVLERPTLALLPGSWRSRFAGSDAPGARALLLASLGVVLGAFTHLAWDAFTHRGTVATNAIPFFHTLVYSGDSYVLRLYGLLQHLSTLIGLAVLARWGAQLLFGRTDVREYSHESLPPVTATDRLFAVLFVTGMSCLLALVNDALNPTAWIEARLFFIAIGGMTGAALGWVLVALSIRNRSRQRRAFVQPGAR
jgi:hypothetical protein